MANYNLCILAYNSRTVRTRSKMAMSTLTDFLSYSFHFFVYILHIFLVKSHLLFTKFDTYLDIWTMKKILICSWNSIAFSCHWLLKYSRCCLFDPNCHNSWTHYEIATIFWWHTHMNTKVYGFLSIGGATAAWQFEMVTTSPRWDFDILQHDYLSLCPLWCRSIFNIR